MSEVTAARPSAVEKAANLRRFGRKSQQVFASFFANSIAHPCAVGSMMRVPTRIVHTRPATWTRSSCLPAADVRGRLSAGDAGGRRWHRNHDGEADAGRFPTPAARHEALRPYGSGEQSPLTRLGSHPLRLSRRRTPNFNSALGTGGSCFLAMTLDLAASFGKSHPRGR